MKKNRQLLFTLIIFLTTLIPSVYHLVKQIDENRIVNDYLKTNKLSKLALTKESVFLVAQTVRKDFNANERTFKALKMNNRPFLREDAGFLLTHREGLCGEGSRVIIRLLNELGFDATRVCLYDRYIQSAHTLVSVKLNGEEFWVNSINSPEEETLFCESSNMNSRRFDYLNYDDEITVRINKVNGFRKHDFKDIYAKYFLFSYEAIPSTKILSKLGLNFRVFNLQRPPRFISKLAESPNLVLHIFYLVLSGGLTFTFQILLKWNSRSGDNSIK